MSVRREIRKYLVRIERLASWILAILLFLFLISGYGLVKPSLVKRLSMGVLTWERCYAIHKNLDLPLIVCFVAHISRCLGKTLLKLYPKQRTLVWTISMMLSFILLMFLLTLCLANG